MRSRMRHDITEFNARRLKLSAAKGEEVFAHLNEMHGELSNPREGIRIDGGRILFSYC